jgi:hypothetical protein
MIYFNLSAHQNIIDEHYTKLESYLLKKIDESSINKNLKDFLKKNLEKIITAKPFELLKLHKEFTSNISYNSASNKKVKKIFNYKYFSSKSDNGSYDGYELAKNLAVRTCLYCNRNYTLTVMKGSKTTEKFTRPEFDHFFDKGVHPLLALSIYNLIPSCKTCNSSLKGRTQFSLNSYLHPFLDDVINFYNFGYKPHDVKSILGESSNLEVEIKIDSGDKKLDKKIEKTKDLFRLEEIFSAHSEELKDFFEIRHRYSQKYLVELFKKYEKLGLKYNEVYKTAFGVNFLESEFSKRPFSKLKKDILKELKII